MKIVNIIRIIFIMLTLPNFILTYPLEYNNHCYEVKDYYTQAHIINRSIIYTIENKTFHGIVNLEYKTLPHCLYTCNMLVIANKTNSHFINKHFDTYFKIGGVLHLTCNDRACSWGNLICNATRVKDEL